MFKKKVAILLLLHPISWAWKEPVRVRVKELKSHVKERAD